MGFVPFFALVAISWLYRDELGGRALAVYWGLWLVGLLVIFFARLHPGFFIAAQSALAIAMLIQLRVNPEVPR
jgi:hypothetical protein